MKTINTTLLTRTVLAALTCASFAACSRNTDQSTVSRDPSLQAPPLASASGTSRSVNDTSSSTTVAANDDSMPAADANPPPVGPSDEQLKTAPHETTTKTTKHTKSKHKVSKKHHPKHSAMNAPRRRQALAPQDRAVIYDEPVVATTTTDTQNNAAVNARSDYDDTVSATTMAAPEWRETGLSPFAQEPASRIPAQIGTGQITGEDRSATIFDKSGFFADPAAQERDLIK